jgi:hypothetical protein
VNLSERPDHPGLEALDQAVAHLADAVEAVRKAEAEVQARKKALPDAIPQVDDSDLAQQLAIWIYWNMPDVPVAPLAAMATGLSGGRAQQAFFKLSGTRASAVACGACGGAVAVRSRDEMKRVLTAKLKRGHLPVCETCRAERRPHTPHPYVERPVSNRRPTDFERELLSLHVARGQPTTIEALCLYGAERVELRPEHIRLYLDDPDAGVAAAHGVSREEYLEWLEGWGSIRCDGITVPGTRCRHTAKGLSGLELPAWIVARERGGYCVVHGG